MGLVESLRNFTQKLGQLFDDEPAPDPETLRESFQARYHTFKLLISANTQALEVMSEMEEALRGRVSFGFGFVRARTARVTTQVYSIIRHLDTLAPGRYAKLFDSFEAIRRDIQAALPQMEKHVEGRRVVALAEIDRNDSAECGTKMAHLGELRNRMELRVPDGFVVTADACRQFMESGGLREEIDRLIQATAASDPAQTQVLASSIARLIMEAEMPPEISAAIEREYEALSTRLGRRPHVAVRSSALGEDESGSSSAGQYRTLLNIHADNLLESYKEVVAALYGAQAMGYRQKRGLDTPPMCVGFLEMVEAEAGGVTYTRDPMSEHVDAVLVSSTWGRPKSIVDGTGLADSFVVDRTTLSLRERDIAFKATCLRGGEGEGMAADCIPPDKASQSSLTDAQVTDLARTCLRIEEQFGYPQDIEFAVTPEGDTVYLQARAVMLTAEPVRRPLPDSAQVIVSGGIRVSGGVGAGKVHHVRKSASALTFEPGGVLVARQPGPDLAVLLPSASAVITELGGVAGHLATVAREFQVPALFGLKDALDSIPDGEMVTVDADGRRVLAGVEESLLEPDDGQANLMEGSPVHKALAAVAEHITPLHLLDPEGLNFRPESCTTLHDITRFCHEKAVAEMFSFGRDHRFRRYEAKQLHVDGNPKQFWVVNLQDGFTTEPKDKWVELGDIACRPMLALWRGMNAFSWDGPPPVDGRGFLSVMFEASMNPKLNVTSGGSLAFKNYFMISREFCSLQSRFGFHFCNVEALVGEYAVENYAGFRFFGGAADSGRRRLRVLLIAEVLEDFGFRAMVREDSLAARIEGRDKDYMMSRLAILGHVIMHTRQLDMIMRDAAQARAYKAKICGQLSEILDDDEFSCRV
jgi:pyruvate,water dikinase